MYDYIFFDLDGTLTEPAEGICNSFVYALKKYGIETADKSVYYRYIGPPLYDSFREHLPEEQVEEAIRYFREYFNEKGKFENEVYPGVPELLAELKQMGKTLILCTSKYELFARQIVEHFSLDKFFDFIAGASADESRSEKEDVIRYACSELGITDLSKAVMVGDRKFDIMGGKTCGLDTLGVLYGYGSLEELKAAGATNIAATVRDILKFV